MKNKKNPRPRIVQCGTWILACLFSGNSPARHPRQNARQAALRRFADNRGGDTRSTYGGVLRRFCACHRAAQHNGGNRHHKFRDFHGLHYTTLPRFRPVALFVKPLPALGGFEALGGVDDTAKCRRRWSEQAGRACGAHPSDGSSPPPKTAVPPA